MALMVVMLEHFRYSYTGKILFEKKKKIQKILIKILKKSLKKSQDLTL
jgi:hypothetical protein